MAKLSNVRQWQSKARECVAAAGLRRARSRSGKAEAWPRTARAMQRTAKHLSVTKIV
nr:MAG TPA: hypothetical protein [Caudoviricetes sp.]